MNEAGIREHEEVMLTCAGVNQEHVSLTCFADLDQLRAAAEGQGKHVFGRLAPERVSCGHKLLRKLRSQGDQPDAVQSVLWLSALGLEANPHQRTSACCDCTVQREHR